MNDNWRITDRVFSREWRRTKVYRKTEIERLARRNGWKLERLGQNKLRVSRGRETFNFQRVDSPEGGGAAPAANERLQAYASLRA